MHRSTETAPAPRRRLIHFLPAVPAMALLLTFTAQSSAASNYRPLRRDFDTLESPFERFEDEDSFSAFDRGRFQSNPIGSGYRPSADDDDMYFPDSRRERYENRYERDPALPALHRRPASRNTRYSTWDDDSDSLGIGGPRNRDKVPWSRDFGHTPFRGNSEDLRDEPNAGPPLRGPALAPRPTAPLHPARSRHATPDAPDPQELISRRYQDPTVLRFLGSLTPDRALAMYTETLQLIETRHLAPPSPQAMVQRGVQNLLLCLQNPTFLEANRLAPMPDHGAGLQQILTMQLQQLPVRSNDDAVAALQRAMQVASQQLQLSPVAVAIEFEYGAIESLDRFSAFVPQESAGVSFRQLDAKVVGIGVKIESAKEGLRILKVMQDGPAAAAGLQQGDTILAVDGQPLGGRDLESASSLISGPEGSAIRLSVARAGGQTTQISLARRSIAVQSVDDARMVDPGAGVGYVKLESFATNSATEMEQALWRLHEQGLRSLILDLRGDPGGLLTTAIQVADMFLPEGTIVSTRGRTPGDNTTETASRENTWKVPLVLLVDENSASASEILAAAIQENGRGVIVGRHTYGKGTVQTLFPLQSVSAGIRLTTAKFYSPKGREMAGAGVEPDIPVPADGSSVAGDPRLDRDLQTAIDVARGNAARGQDVSQYQGLRQPRGAGYLLPPDR